MPSIESSRDTIKWDQSLSINNPLTHLSEAIRVLVEDSNKHIWIQDAWHMLSDVCHQKYKVGDPVKLAMEYSRIASRTGDLRYKAGTWLCKGLKAKEPLKRLAHWSLMQTYLEMQP